MAKIRRLDDRLISQIAAGEVVERPASVVKEAVENSLDAGAGRVEVELELGGRHRILVRDDGTGMAATDATLAFERHATSKISDFEDLLQVATLGFRGEALAAIGAVSKVELLTAESAGEGQRVRCEGGRLTLTEPAPSPRGTRLDVRSLFFNVPARRKFLKRPASELRRSLEVLQGYALARPDVAFRLLHDDRELLRADATSDDEVGRTERIAQLFGAELAANLERIGPGEGIAGFVGNPKTVRGRRLFVFVNRRLIRDRALLAVFYRCVRKEWGSERFPALFLFLDLPPQEVDVNVHPQKSEVRFRDPRLLDRVAGHFGAALAATRGEVEAPLGSAPSPVGALPPLAWEGAGARNESGSPLGSAGSLVAEPRGEGPSAAPRIAETTYRAPAASSPLSAGGTGSLRLLGQYKGALILLEGPEALYLVDQHAAHERILYERFRRQLAAQQRHGQALVTPLMLELAPAEAAQLAGMASALESFGFELAAFSGSTVAVSAVPSALSQTAAEALLFKLASLAAGEDTEAAPALESRLLDALAASQACRAAIKIHRPLAQLEMEQVISELFAAETPFSCPHGRPTLLKMEDRELERRFGRR